MAGDADVETALRWNSVDIASHTLVSTWVIQFGFARALSFTGFGQRFGGDDADRIDGGRTGIAVVDQLPSCFNLRNRFTVLILAFSVVSVIIHFRIDSAESRRQFSLTGLQLPMIHSPPRWYLWQIMIYVHMDQFYDWLRSLSVVWIAVVLGFRAYVVLARTWLWALIIAFARSNAKTIARICWGNCYRVTWYYAEVIAANLFAQMMR